MTREIARVIYIAGYGRSGSTVLSAILGSHPNIVAVGEVAFLGEEIQMGDRLCSCGALYDQCDFWKDLVRDDQWLADHESVRSDIERFFHLYRMFLHPFEVRNAGRYCAAERDLFNHICETAGTRYVVDSSKSAWRTSGRALALNRLLGVDVYVIHLIRDGRRVLDSLVRQGSNWALEGRRRKSRLRVLRGTIGWVAANVVAEISGRAVGSDRYLRLRFDEFLEDPAHALDEIGAFLGLEMTAPRKKIDDEESFAVGHMVGGNRVRFEQDIELRRPEQEHRAARNLAFRSRMTFGVLGGWLNAVYGFKR